MDLPERLKLKLYGPVGHQMTVYKEFNFFVFLFLWRKHIQAVPAVHASQSNTRKAVIVS